MQKSVLEHKHDLLSVCHGSLPDDVESHTLTYRSIINSMRITRLLDAGFRQVFASETEELANRRQGEDPSAGYHDPHARTSEKRG
jgi:hypothetical protein